MNDHMNELVATVVDRSRNMPSLYGSTVTQDTFILKARLCNDVKKGRWKKCVQMVDGRKKISMK